MTTCLEKACSFCTLPTYTRFRCDTYQNLELYGCSGGVCGSPAIKVSIDPNRPPSPTQTMTLCPNENKTFEVTFKLESHPLDVYVLLDLSGSMGDDRENLIRLSNHLASEIAKISTDFHLGYGAHVDKPRYPFGTAGYE